MMLVAAKWRDFMNQNPHAEPLESDAAEEQEYAPKPSRTRAAKVSAHIKDGRIREVGVRVEVIEHGIHLKNVNKKILLTFAQK